MSSSKRLQNDIIVHEENSDRCVPNNSYFIICLRSSPEESPNLNTLTKKLIKDPKILVAYVYDRTSYLVFSAIEEGEHYLSGKHHALISKYTSLAVLELGCEVETQLIELDNKTKVVVYLYSQICENMKLTAMKVSKGVIDKKILSQLSFNEIKKELSDRSIIWDSIPGEERYGTIYKYIEGGNGVKPKYQAMSEMINLNNLSKYTDYIFS